MNITKTMLALVGAAVLATGAFANPSITLNRVQQRYPWNGLVDIDYTVAGVDQPTNYYVKFTVETNGVADAIIASVFLDDSTLVNASNGTYRVTWHTTNDGYQFFDKGATVKADLVFSPGDKSASPYYLLKYLVIDLSAGPGATHYPVTTEYFATLDEATNKYSAAEYKTNKLVLRRIKRGTFTMGSPENEIARGPNTTLHGETQHQVTLTRDFLMGIYEFTQRQYELVMGTNPSPEGQKEGPDAPSRPVTDVVYTDWHCPKNAFAERRILRMCQMGLLLRAALWGGCAAGLA